MEVFTGCLTDRGNYREKNQDCAVCHKMKRKNSVLTVACVCDGIGSFPKSEIASNMTAEGITRWFHGVKELFPDSMDEETLVEDLEMTIRELNELVYLYGRNKEIDIGCTMSLMLVVNRTYYVFHVGDSRIYQVKENLHQITWDEVSVVESRGQVKRLLANFIGKSKTLWMNKINGSIEEDEVFLIGTDGLFKKLVLEDVCDRTAYIESDIQAQEVCETLLDVVLSRGERDNISCILLHVTGVR